MTTQRQGWARGALKLVIGNASTTTPAPYSFDDDTHEIPELPLQEWARRCQLAHADLEIEKTCLVEAQNHVVHCEGKVAKAELFLERQQAGYLEAAAKLPGVPCRK